MNSLEKQVLRYIGENVASPDVFTDGTGMQPIRDSLNEAIQEIQMLTGGYTETFFLPLVSGKTFYRLSFIRGHYAWVEHAFLTTQKRKLVQTGLPTLDQYDPRWMVHTGTPDYYFQVGLDVIGVAPRPSASTDVLQLKLAVIPGAYEYDNERIKLKRSYHRAAVHYAVGEYYAGRGDAARAQAHLAAYLDRLGGIIARPDMGDARPRFDTVKQVEVSEMG